MVSGYINVPESVIKFMMESDIPDDSGRYQFTFQKNSDIGKDIETFMSVNNKIPVFKGEVTFTSVLKGKYVVVGETISLANAHAIRFKLPNGTLAISDNDSEYIIAVETV